MSAITYLPFGPVESLTYANGLVADYAYDQDYRLTGITTGDSGGDVQDLTIVYDDADNITAITDHLDAARTQSFTYDALNRLETASGLYGSYAYGYDANGNRQSRDLTGGSQESYLTEALSNRLTSVTAGGVTRGFSYDAAGNMTADDRGADPDLAFTFDQSGRLAQVTEGGLTIGDYGVNALGQRVEKTAGGASRHFHYGPSGVLLSESDDQGDLLVSTIYLEGLPIAQVTPSLGGSSLIDVIVDDGDAGASGSADWTTETSSDAQGNSYARFIPDSSPSAETVIDNASASFSTFGPWSLLNDSSEQHGADYRARSLYGDNGPVIVLDNSDPGFVVRGDWTLASDGTGQHGTDYLYKDTKGAPPEAEIIDNLSAGFSTSGSLWSELIQTDFWGPSGHMVRDIDLPAEALIVDNDDPNNVISGSWSTGTNTYAYGSDYRYVDGPATGGTRRFNWYPPITTSGAYKVFTRTRTNGAYVTDAPFKVIHAGGNTTVSLDQSDFALAGDWRYLGTFDFTAGSSQRVQLRDEYTNGSTMLADAVAFVPDEVAIAPATWTPSLPAAGSYDIYAYWKEAANRTTQARFLVHHDGGRSEVVKDQTSDGGQWNLLGTYAMTPGQNHRVEAIHLEAGQRLIADAIRIEPAGTAPPSVTWPITVSEDNIYELEAIWPEGASDSSDAIYRVTDANGSSALLADQRLPGGAFQPLGGGFIFEAGESYQVTLDDLAGGETIAADAIRLTPSLVAIRSAAWTFQVPASGRYLVSATWAAGPDRATDAPFTVDHDGGSSILRMNQQAQGGQWNQLGAFDFTAGIDYQVTLSDDADGLVVADAIQLRPTSEAPFLWSVSLPQSGTYEVYARWPADDDRSTAAVYEIIHELGTDSVTVNQRANGGQWVLLGTYDFEPAQGPAEVTLDGLGDGSLAADAVRFVEAGAGAPAEVAYLHSDQLGRPQIVTDATGLLAWDRTQTPFGETVTETGFESTALRFPGQYADAETGLNYNYFRDYDPSLGRYVESDPRGILLDFSDPRRLVATELGIENNSALYTFGTNNPYSYANQGPQTFIDPTGENPIAIFIGIIKLGTKAYKKSKKLWDDLDFDGPSPGMWYGNGRVCQIRYKSQPVFRLDYHPYKGTNGESRLHGHFGRGGGHTPLDPRSYFD